MAGAAGPHVPPDVPERPAVTRSNAFSLLVVLVRAGALYMLVAALTRIAPLLWDNVRLEMLGPLLTGVAVLVAVAAVLWLFADLVARAALAGPDAPRIDSTLDYGQWQALAFSLLGLWLAATGLLDLVWNAVAVWWASRESGAGAERLGADQLAAFVAGALQVALGIALLLGHRGLVALLARLRG